MLDRPDAATAAALARLYDLDLNLDLDFEFKLLDDAPLCLGVMIDKEPADRHNRRINLLRSMIGEC